MGNRTADIHWGCMRNGKYLNSVEETFDGLLLNVLLNKLEPGGHPEVDVLNDAIKTDSRYNRYKQAPQDVLFHLLFHNVKLDFDFAKDLKLFDVLTSDCFSRNNHITNALIYLMFYTDTEFVVVQRKFRDPDQLEIYLEPCYVDSVMELINDLITGRRSD